MEFIRTKDGNLVDKASVKPAAKPKAKPRTKRPKKVSEEPTTKE